jgi:hypothetical protein
MKCSVFLKSSCTCLGGGRENHGEFSFRRLPLPELVEISAHPQLYFHVAFYQVSFDQFYTTKLSPQIAVLTSNITTNLKTLQSARKAQQYRWSKTKRQIKTILMFLMPNPQCAYRTFLYKYSSLNP